MKGCDCEDFQNAIDEIDIIELHCDRETCYRIGDSLIYYCPFCGAELKEVKDDTGL